MVAGIPAQTHRVVLGVDGKDWDPDVHNRVDGRGVAVVGALCRIAPRGSLNLPVKLVQVGDVAYLFDVDVSIGQHHFRVSVFVKHEQRFRVSRS